VVGRLRLVATGHFFPARDLLPCELEGRVDGVKGRGPELGNARRLSTVTWL